MPWRRREAEASLVGRPLGDEAFHAAAALAIWRGTAGAE
jgi:CO/xanthine dehydrogenase FAD-binding subunit